MSEAFDVLSESARGQLRQAEMPSWTEPMRAKLTHEPFSRDGWIYERKLDGVRCLVFKSGDNVRLMSRNQKELNPAYPELVEAMQARRGGPMIVDGEIVAFRGNLTSFEELQKRMQIRDPRRAQATGVAVFLYLFDILHLAGYDVSKVPLRERKKLLKAALRFEDPIRYTTHRNATGEELLDQACERGWEGLIAKRGDSPYQHKRSTDWLKLKCLKTQEMVIGGYTDPQGSRTGFGSLLLGYYSDRKFRYAGKAGTGFDEQTLRRLHDKLQQIETDRRPFADRDISRRGVHWVKPELVGEFTYTEVTRDGRLRHPRFRGLRHDKAPEDVRLER
ncbi:MAG: non-homologous end-joining DNA ligase [Planctomycetota bacterium]